MSNKFDSAAEFGGTGVPPTNYMFAHGQAYANCEVRLYVYVRTYMPHFAAKFKIKRRFAHII